MSGAGQGQTTIPSRSARGRGAVGAVTAIRWVFPEEGWVPLDRDRLLLGRGEDCDAVLPGRETSRHHAEICRDGPLLVLRDLASRNGVNKNGARTLETPLAVGDVIRLGEWIGLVGPFGPRGFGALAEGLLGGERLAEAMEPARRAAPSDLPIVVGGATGTGKERAACAIHGWSGRTGQFVAVNCAALPESLAEAELFGHRKGAFTGATRDTPGYFRAAHKGTLLLDEIVDLPAPVQAKLLRVIELGQVVPLGDTQPVAVDVRLVVAAQSPLRLAVAEKRFRADLLARLEGVSIELPPLRERREDVPGLFLDALQRHAGGQPPSVEPRVIERLCLHDWPYNVRELIQLARRLLALHAGAAELTEEHLGAALRCDPAPPASGSAPKSSEGRRERRNPALLQRLREALERHAGNVTQAAAALGISRQRAYRLMEQSPGVDLDALRIPDPADGQR